MLLDQNHSPSNRSLNAQLMELTTTSDVLEVDSIKPLDLQETKLSYNLTFTHTLERQDFAKTPDQSRMTSIKTTLLFFQDSKRLNLTILKLLKQPFKMDQSLPLSELETEFSEITLTESLIQLLAHQHSQSTTTITVFSSSDTAEPSLEPNTSLLKTHSERTGETKDMR